LREDSTRVVVIQQDGTLSLCKSGNKSSDIHIKVEGIGPYTLVTGDLDRDSVSEIVVSDSRHGLWVYEKDMTLALGWLEKANDKASMYAYIDTTIYSSDDRKPLALNFSPPALADIDKD